MGLPSGHVTEVPGLGRKAQLRALGNGVVPQQAALALRMLLADGIRGVDSAGIVRGHGALAGSGPA
jgi:DNA (cytosine-5)-methyltransferase 1